MSSTENTRTCAHQKDRFRRAENHLWHRLSSQHTRSYDTVNSQIHQGNTIIELRKGSRTALTTSTIPTTRTNNLQGIVSSYYSPRNRNSNDTTVNDLLVTNLHLWNFAFVFSKSYAQKNCVDFSPSSWFFLTLLLLCSVNIKFTTYSPWHPIPAWTPNPWSLMLL